MDPLPILILDVINGRSLNTISCDHDRDKFPKAKHCWILKYIYFLKLKAAEVEVKQCKKDVDAAKKQWGAKEAEEAALTMEIDELKKAIDEGKFVLKFLLGSEQVQNSLLVIFWLNSKKFGSVS